MTLDEWRFLFERVRRRWRKQHPFVARMVADWYERQERPRRPRVPNVTRKVPKFSPVRFNVERRWCAYCAAPAETFDHVEPFVRSRDNSSDNLVPACRWCNHDKADLKLVVFLALSA